MPHNNNGDSPMDTSSSSGDESDIEDEKTFCDRLYKFMIDRGTPIEKIPIFDHKELDLYQLYKGVIMRGGLETVIENKLWRQITNELAVDPERTDAGFRLRIHYLKYLYPYERKFFLGLGDDDFDYDAYERQISKSHYVAGSRERSIRSLPVRRKRMARMNGGHYPHRRSGGVASHSIHLVGRDMENDHETQLHRTTNTSLAGSLFDRQAGITASKKIMPLPSPLVINFKQLDVGTLKKYKKHHKVRVAGNPTKRELTDAVVEHFASQKVDEDAVINTFIAHVKANREQQREREQRRRNASRKILPTYDERF